MLNILRTVLKNYLKNAIRQNERGEKMNNDLISRKALKEEMDRPFWEKWEWEFICKSIDNAPTVDLKDIYQEGYHDGYLKGCTMAINEKSLIRQK